MGLKAVALAFFAGFTGEGSGERRRDRQRRRQREEMSTHVLEPFPHQVAGQSLVFRYDADTICKSLIERELRVYQTLPDVLRPFVPQYRGVVDIPLNGPQTDVKEEEEEEEEGRRRKGGVKHPLTTQRLLNKVAKRQGHDNVYHFLLLENLVSGQHRPCVLDLKLGTRQHGDDAPSHKVRYQVSKCRNSTSALLGVRLCGMKVFQSATGQYITVDKTEGRRMRENDFREAMRHFLFNGRHVRRELIPLLLLKLQRLKAAVSDLSSFRFYSSSLLVVYDGWEGATGKCKHGAPLETRPTVSANGAQEFDSVNSPCGLRNQYRGFDNPDCERLKKTQVAENLDPNLPRADRCDSCDHDNDDLTSVGSGGDGGVQFQDSTSPACQEDQQRRESRATEHPDGGGGSSGTCVPPCQKQSESVVNGQSVSSSQQSTVTLPRSSSIQNTNTVHQQKATRECVVSSSGNSSRSCGECCGQRTVVNSCADTSLLSTEKENSPHKGMSLIEETATECGQSSTTESLTGHSGGGGCGCWGAGGGLVDVRMVDFAHTTHAGLGENRVVHQGPDRGCLLGLSTLIEIFTHIYNATTAHQQP
ncbi:uncharacterized protein LOC143279964 isoform X2 [Babylonia areolata]|uniref:uncharacterized protein LOC143279964 isoform X2 n=1 Tax=Babylonia areolata TaxID=304850 RepID=UPI003FD0AD72